MTWLLTLVFAAQPALAGDGPWTLNPGEVNVYLGGDYFRYGEFHGGSGESTELGSPLTAAGITGVATLGLLHGLEVELVVPYEAVRANEPESTFCENGPRQQWCKRTAGIGDLSMSLKGRLLDELWSSPVSLAVSAGVRSGEAYASKRARLTTLGDGQSDVGGGLHVGRTASLGKGWYRAGMSGWYWYRFPNIWGDGQKIPADEISFSGEAAFSFGKPWAIGPAVYGFHKLGGVDIADADFDSMDIWGSLNANQIKVGGKIGVFGAGKRTVSLAVLRTVYARNNPSDTLSISVGIGWFLQPDPTRSKD